jgi:AcrR family transcriptional regulator
MLSSLSFAARMHLMPHTARERVRAEVTAEIVEVARRHLAEHGASALSLRAIAREVGMVSSAVYRYFPSRDDLLTRLIVDAYGAVGAAAETADGGRRRGDHAGRWLATARAIRGWAVDHPHEYALIYGSPVPGYRAPVDTIDPAARVSLVFLSLVADAVAAGTVRSVGGGSMPAAVRAELGRLRDLAAPGVPDDVLARGLAVWTQLFGTISFQLFGHLQNVIEHHDAFFDVQARAAWRYLSEG